MTEDGKMELLACPFCGCGDISVAWVDWSYRAVCVPPMHAELVEAFGKGGAGCGGYGPSRFTVEAATAAWNTRLAASLPDGSGQTSIADCGQCNEQSAQGLSRATGGEA